jgi:hypothetical protein
MRSRTAVLSPPSWRRFDIDAVAITLSLTTVVPYSTTSWSCPAGKEQFLMAATAQNLKRLVRFLAQQQAVPALNTA